MTAILDRVVAEVTLHRVKVLPADATPADVERFFASDHVHLAVVVDDRRRVVSAITRDELRPTGRAAELGTLDGRCVPPDAPLEAVHSQMLANGLRRLVVVDDAGRLVGLLCLKRHRRGFCSDDDVRCREADRD